MRRPTIYDVAERAGVSKSLVSLVLRNSPKVSDEKRAAVLAAVAELEYTPSRLAAGLAGTRTRSIGVVVDDFANLWFVEALAGLRAALEPGGYALSVADARLNAHLGVDPIDAFRALRVDGIVLAGEAGAESVARADVPVVVLGTRAVHAPSLPVIASDEVEGGRLATRHLADLGHRRIVCVSGPGASAAARERGYREALADLGVAPRVVAADSTEEGAARMVAAELFRSAAGASSSDDAAPTAVFAVNDPMAVGVIGAARDAGLSVPGDLSVVGYDDSPLAAYGIVALSTVSGDPRELGEAAGEVLLARLGSSGAGSRAGASPVAGSRIFAPELVVRGTTGPLLRP